MREQLDIFRHDVAYAVRQLRRSPGFAMVALLSLAIGTGANATVYSVAHAFLERPVDAARPDELVRVYRGEHSPLPRDWFLHFARHSRTLADLIAEDPMPLGVGRGGGTERARGAVVSANFFRALGVGPAVGSVFSGRPGAPVGSQVVLANDYWTAHFGGDPTVVGSTLRLNGLPFTVVGVAQKGFRSSQFGWAPDLFVPLSEQARLRGLPPGSHSSTSFYVTGRLAAGATQGRVRAELQALAPTLPDAPPEASLPGAFQVAPARGITAEARPPVTVVSVFMIFVVGIVLLIACGNLANLLLARANARRREVAIRQALGVSRLRLVRQLLTESVVMASLGAVGGLVLAFYVTALIPALIPAPLRAELLFDVRPDASVFPFMAALAVGSGVLFGLAPALQASRADVSGMLRSEGQGGGSRRSRWRSGFLVAQVGLATVLLVGAGLFLRGLGAARLVETGYRSDRVVDVPLDLSLRQYGEAKGRRFYANLLERVRGLGAVESAALTSILPLTGSSRGTGVSRGEAEPTDRRAQHAASLDTVTPGYFAMFGIPLVEGRDFEDRDGPESPGVVVVNQTLARLLWPGEEAVGRTVRFGDAATFTVIGVAKDVKYAWLAERQEPFVYFPAAQDYRPVMVLQARLAADTPAASAMLRRAVQSVDPALPVPAASRFSDDMGLALLPARAGAGLLGLFGALALLLASLGVYGVTAYLVSQRGREVGVRTALGATRRDVLGLMMRDTLVLVASGLGFGLVGGIALGRVASGWLYGVGSLDPAALAGASAVLIGASLAGTWLPARRALGVDPVEVLKSE